MTANAWLKELQLGPEEQRALTLACQATVAKERIQASIRDTEDELAACRMMFAEHALQGSPTKVAPSLAQTGAL